jgi:hypothetical protein
MCSTRDTLGGDVDFFRTDMHMLSSKAVHCKHKQAINYGKQPY